MSSICKISNLSLTEAIYRGSIEVIEILAKFFVIWKKFGDKLGLPKKMSVLYTNTFKVTLPLEEVVSRVMRQFNWHLGLLAHNLIKIDQEEKQ